MPNPPEWPLPLILIYNIFEGASPPSSSYNFKLKYLKISRQNITNLISIFGAIHIGIMQAKFQASSFTGVGGE